MAHTQATDLRDVDRATMRMIEVLKYGIGRGIILGFIELDGIKEGSVPSSISKIHRRSIFFDPACQMNDST